MDTELVDAPDADSQTADDPAVPEPTDDALQRAQRDLPGGALLTVYPDGPILVRGDFELVGRDGQAMRRQRATIALCRCGHSALKPYCDGSHKLSKFSDA